MPQLWYNALSRFLNAFQVLADGQITTCQFPQRLQPIFSVVDRAQQAGAQQFGQLSRIDLVALAALFQQSVATRVADHHLPHVGLEHVVQPRRPSPFFQRHMQLSAQPMQEIEHSAGFVFHDRLHDQLPRTIYNRNRNRFLVNVQADILHIATQHAGYLLSEEPLPPRSSVILPEPAANTPSADSVASTDTGGCSCVPLPLSGPVKLPIGRGTKALNPGGVGAKPPQACVADPDCLLKQGALS